MKSINDITSLNTGTRVLVRASLNATLSEKGEVLNPFRLKEATRTLVYLREKGARIVVIGHHSGESLAPVSRAFPLKHTFINSLFDERVHTHLSSMKNGDIVLLENLRSDKREKEGSRAFARSLAQYGEIYIFDAFPVAHRHHSSCVCLPLLLPSYAGIRFSEEIETLTTLLKPKISLYVFGGAKVKTKLPLFLKILKRGEYIVAGGVLLNTLLRDAGYFVGNSVVEEGNTTTNIFEYENFITPRDVRVITNTQTTEIRSLDAIQEGDTIVDVGPRTVDSMISVLSEVKRVVWNGPLGWYEKGYDESTHLFNTHLLNTSLQVIIGGGDLTTLVLKEKRPPHIYYSTGGGALFYYLLNESLPVLPLLE